MNIKKKQKKTGFRTAGVIFFALAVFFTLLAYHTAFADWYTLHIYRILADFFGRLNDRIPFLLGEILMYAAACAVFVLLALVLVVLFRHRRKTDRLRGILKRYAAVAALISGVVLLVYTMLWTIPYHTSELTFGVSAEKEYTIEDIVTLRNQITTDLNQLVQEVERDEAGYPLEPENIDAQTRQAVLALGEDFPMIGSYAPEGKSALCSMFLKWMGIGGFTFPYTQEICMNKYVNAFYYPTLYAHELAHHMGFYREDEGVFISYLALTNSDSTFLQYSACFTIWFYVQNAYEENLQTLPAAEQNVIRMDEVDVDARAFVDNAYFDGLLEEIYEEEVSDSVESTFSGVSESIAEVGWDVQEDLLAEASYDHVVELLLRYYDD